MWFFTIYLALLLCLCNISHAVAPQLTMPARASVVKGQLVYSDVTMLQYDLEFDQDLHYLQAIPCVGVEACLPSPSCAACDYSDPSSPSCGTSPSGSQCPCPDRSALCNISTVFDRDPFGGPQRLQLGSSINALTSENAEGLIEIPRIYIPSNSDCPPIRISVDLHHGYLEYVAATFEPGGLSFPPWQTRRDFYRTLTLCPEHTLYPTGGGTLYITVQAASADDSSYLPCNFSITARSLSSVAPLSNNSAPNLFPLPPFQLLPPESLVAIASANEFYAVALTGPCPLLFAATVTFDPSQSLTEVSLYASLDAEAITVGWSWPPPASVWFDSAEIEARLELSLCPADYDESSGGLLVYMRFNAPVPATLFVTTDRRKFFTVPVLPPDTAHSSPMSVARSLGYLTSVDCGGTDQLFFSMKNNWMTCWACAYFPYSMLLPPIPGAAPTWPLVSIAVVAYPYLRLSAPPPSLITDVSYDPRLLRIVAPTAVHVRGYLSAWENLWVTPAELSNCVVLLGPNLVNAAAEAVSLDPVAGEWQSPVCSVDQFRAVESEAVMQIARLSPANTPLQNDYITAELDALELGSTWQSCVATSGGLFEEEVALVEADTELCGGEGWYPSPCCDVQELINEGACLPSPGLVIGTNRTERQAEIVAMPASECVATYVAEYGRTADLSCVDDVLLPYEWLAQQVFVFGQCQAEAFGQYGEGKSCTRDVDCPTSPHATFPSWCDKSRGLCVRSVHGAYRDFVRCVFSNVTTYFFTQLCAHFGLPASLDPASDELVDRVMSRVADVSPASPVPSGDCLADTEIGPWQSYQNVAIEEGCTMYCTQSPFMLTTLGAYPTCMAGSSLYEDGCQFLLMGRIMVERTDAEACSPSASKVCNWNQGVADRAQCVARAPFCGLCYNSTYCVPFAEVGDKRACETSALACQLQNGSTILLTGSDVASLERECARLESCSEPCWEADSQAYVTCTDAKTCIAQGGRCADDDLWHNDTSGSGEILAGACVFSSFGDQPCSEVYSFNISNTQMTSSPYGCVMHNFDEEHCLKSSDSTARWVLPARSEVECSAHGQGCIRPVLRGFDHAYPTYGTALWMPPLHDGNATCDVEWCESSGGVCRDYTQWSAGLWQGGEPRRLTWITPNLVPFAKWTDEPFSLWLFSLAYAEAAKAAYQAIGISTQQCRFNRFSESLEAIACATVATDANITACLDRIDSDKPVSSGYLCKSQASTLLAPLASSAPASLSVAEHSTSSCDALCSAVSLFKLPAVRFIAPDPPLGLSTYWTPPLPYAPSGSLIFTNEHGALVGQVVGEAGMRVVLASCSSLSHATLCFPSPAIANVSEDFTEPDFAAASLDNGVLRIRPLRVSVTDDSVTWCAALNRVTSDTVYVPVIRTAESATQRPVHTLTRRAVACLSVSAAGCAAVALLAFITLVVLLVQRGGGVFVLIPFYLLLFLGGALLIRAVYFSLLARGDIEGAVVSAGSVLLIELPTFLWFTSLTLVILFWAMTSNSLHAKQLLRRVWLLFLATNAAMYIVLLSVLVAFAVTRDRVTLACQGRQPARIDQSRKRAMLLTYQVLLAVMGVGIGGVYAYISIRLLRRVLQRGKEVAASERLHPQEQAEQEESAVAQLRSMTWTGVFVSVCFALHAIYLLTLALVQPGIPELSLLVIVTEVVPAALLIGRWLPQWLKPVLHAADPSAETSDSDHLQQHLLVSQEHPDAL